MEKEFFSVNVSKYVPTKNFCVTRPASLNNPKDNSVMFVREAYVERLPNKFNDVAESLCKAKECLVFWPESIEVPAILDETHAVVRSSYSRLSFCKFFKENNISYYLPKDEQVEYVDGAFISPKAKIGEGAVIMPGAYISSEVTIGKNAYIGAGTKIMGKVTIGDDFCVRENCVIGSDSLTTDCDETGRGIPMPQFGGVVIGNDVRISSGCVIGRGAIDNTIICDGVRMGDLCFVAHNGYVGENSFLITSVALFGSVKIGKNCMISGNSTVRNYVSVGDNCIVGLGSVVVKNIPANSVVKGNPAK